MMWAARLKVRQIRLLKGREEYRFYFLPRTKTELLYTFGRYAVRKDLSFTWYDAAVLSQKVRAMR